MKNTGHENLIQDAIANIDGHLDYILRTTVDWAMRFPEDRDSWPIDSFSGHIQSKMSEYLSGLVGKGGTLRP